MGAMTAAKTAHEHEHREDDQADAGVALPEEIPERVPPQAAASRSGDLAIDIRRQPAVDVHQDGRTRGSRKA